jgi:predicted dehydrogenase
VTTGGEPFRIGSPDLIIAAVELESGAVMRLTTSFWVGRPAKMVGAIEFHGEDGSLALESFQTFDAAVEAGDYGEEYQVIAPVRPPYKGTAWGRGVADMAAAIHEGRPHRATGDQAAHVVEILNGVAESIRDGGRRIEISSTFSAPAPMPWAADGTAAEATA